MNKVKKMPSCSTIRQVITKDYHEFTIESKKSQLRMGYCQVIPALKKQNKGWTKPPVLFFFSCEKSNPFVQNEFNQYNILILHKIFAIFQFTFFTLNIMRCCFTLNETNVSETLSIYHNKSLKR